MSQPNNAFDQKHILLTGATGGIGAAAARAFALGGARLTLVARDAAKGKALLADLQALAPERSRVGMELADLSSLQQVRALARRYRFGHDRLDVLANNAGMLFMPYERTVDGFERTFALDHLAPFVLTQELLPLLRATPGAKVITTASAAHRLGTLDLDRVATRPELKAGWAAYGDAKLANILFAAELARRENGQVLSYSYHPGWVRTGFALNNGGFTAAFNRVAGRLFARSPERGADTLLWLASSAAKPADNGGYFSDRSLGRSSAKAKDADLAARLWALSEALVGPPSA